MKIRQAITTDIPGLVKNRMDFIFCLKNIMPPQIFEGKTKAYFEQHLGGKDFAAWVAIEGDEIVSACMLCITDQIPTPICPNGKMGYVYNVFTQEAYRGQGLATHLLKELQRYSAEQGILSIRLQATKDGISVYQQLGFEQQTNEMLWNVKACPA
jgi:ribosomal protein S18 acetylase RimI-like enzyme